MMVELKPGAKELLKRLAATASCGGVSGMAYAIAFYRVADPGYADPLSFHVFTLASVASAAISFVGVLVAMSRLHPLVAEGIFLLGGAFGIAVGVFLDVLIHPVVGIGERNLLPFEVIVVGGFGIPGFVFGSAAGLVARSVIRRPTTKKSLTTNDQDRRLMTKD
jgi:hypothetical protein